MPLEVDDTEGATSLYFRDMIFTLLKGEVYFKDLSIEAKKHDSTTTPAQTLANFLYWADSGSDDEILNQYSSSSREFVKKVPNETLEKVFDGMRTLQGYSLRLFIEEGDDVISLVRQKIDGVESPYYIPSLMTKENEELRVKAGEVSFIYLSNIITALNSRVEHQMTDNYLKVIHSSNQIEANMPVGVATGFSVTGTASDDDEMTWYINDEKANDYTNIDTKLTFHDTGVYRIQAFTDKIKSCFPTKIISIGIESLNITVDSGSYKEVAFASVGQEVLLTPVSTFQSSGNSIWPEDSLSWTGDNLIISSDNALFKPMASGNYNISVSCGNSTATALIRTL